MGRNSIMTVNDIYKFIDEIAPFKYQAGSDNCGIIVGDKNAQVNKVLVCLDVTNDVVFEANKKGVDLIISHHPLMYSPVSTIKKSDPLHALVSSNINLIAVHTNIDIASDGVSDLMLCALNFPKSNTPIIPIGGENTGFGRIIQIDEPMSAKELAEKCKAAFNSTVIRYVDADKPIKKIGVSSGSAAETVDMALDAGCDAFICGEVKYSKLLFAKDHGLTLIEAGHFHTENIFCDDMVTRLKARFAGINAEKAANSVDVCSYV